MTEGMEVLTCDRGHGCMLKMDACSCGMRAHASCVLAHAPYIHVEQNTVSSLLISNVVCSCVTTAAVLFWVWFRILPPDASGQEPSETAHLIAAETPSRHADPYAALFRSKVIRSRTSRALGQDLEDLEDFAVTATITSTATRTSPTSATTTTSPSAPSPLPIHGLGRAFHPRHLDVCGAVFVALKVVFLATSIAAFSVWPSRGAVLGRDSRKSVLSA